MLQKLIQDDLTDADAGLFSGMMDVLVRHDCILEKKDPFAYTSNIIVVKSGTVLTIHNAAWKSFRLSADVELTGANLDAGSTFMVGEDYYVYLVDNQAHGQFVISLNATFPAGYNANNSRKIGGFHFGHIRRVSLGGLWTPVDSEGTRFGAGSVGWRDNVTTGIVPNSVWDLVNRPRCSPEGMVKVGHIWVDIYIASAAESITLEGGTNGLHVASGRLQSRYGQIPVSGSEGLNWYNFNELAARSNKRLLSYGEWVRMAYGNPQGLDAADTYGWTKTTNTARTRTGCRVNASTGAHDAATGIKPAAISAYNVVDTVGNLWEWLDELSNRHDTTAFAWQDVLGFGKGQAFLPNNLGLVAYIAGAYWREGVRAGPRAIHVSSHPWLVYATVGSRLACDSL